MLARNTLRLGDPYIPSTQLGNRKDELSTLRFLDNESATCPLLSAYKRPNFIPDFVAKKRKVDDSPLDEFALYISTVLLNSSRTCNNPRHGTPPDRNQDQGYRRELASLSVVKERLVPSPSECPRVSGTCLVGLIEPQRAARPSSVIFRS